LDWVGERDADFVREDGKGLKNDLTVFPLRFWLP
jgi:hypothetical protein